MEKNIFCLTFYPWTKINGIHEKCLVVTDRQMLHTWPVRNTKSFEFFNTGNENLFFIISLMISLLGHEMLSIKVYQTINILRKQVQCPIAQHLLITILQLKLIMYFVNVGFTSIFLAFWVGHDKGRYHIETSPSICGSMDWFLYDNGLRHERVKELTSLSGT